MAHTGGEARPLDEGQHVHRVRGATKIFCALGSAVIVLAATAPAIASATSVGPVGATPSVPASLASSTAATQAGAAYAQSAATAGASVPLVTVETTASGPRIIAHPVTSPAQARAVATEAAVGNDLVAVQSDTIVSPVGAPTNDSYARYQWGLDRTKTTFANAWPTTNGRGITVAVVDTGVDASHPDLAGQVLAGKAFLTGTTDPAALNPRVDTCGHGTHVSGTIAALTNNGVGVAGAAPGVKILPVKVLNKAFYCSGYSSDVANGIKWAANNGARVINLSLGSTARDSAQDLAISYARSKGVVVVAAAGNNHGPVTTCIGSPGTNARLYPAASPGVIAVGAMDESFNRACFSNTGDYVDLVAPGAGVLSTFPQAQMPAPPAGQAPYPPYVYMSGTSMATPHVAAAAALVLSRKLTCTPDQVEILLEATARRLGGTTRNNNFGYGLVNPAKAISFPAC